MVMFFLESPASMAFLTKLNKILCSIFLSEKIVLPYSEIKLKVTCFIEEKRFNIAFCISSNWIS